MLTDKLTPMQTLVKSPTVTKVWATLHMHGHLHTLALYTVSGKRVYSTGTVSY